jgi:DNA-binding MarR family transcriptional regulator
VHPQPSAPEQGQGLEATSDLLMSAARSIRRSFADAMAAYDVTPSQARALRIVGEHGPVRLSVIAEHLRIAPRSATEVVDALEARGLVAREPDPADRRATQVVVTAEGGRLRAVLDRARRTASEQRLAVLDERDRAELERLLRLVVDREPDR